MVFVITLPLIIGRDGDEVVLFDHDMKSVFGLEDNDWVQSILLPDKGHLFHQSIVGRWRISYDSDGIEALICS